MKKRSFLILHGFEGSDFPHWQSWLYQELKQRGEIVYFPQFTDKYQPKKDVWLSELNEILKSIPEDEEITLVAHSLGCILWFHYASSVIVRKVRRAILVAPPAPFTKHEAMSTFFPVPENITDIVNGAERTLLIHSSSDHYCSTVDVSHYLKISVPHIVLPNQGHINTQSGHGPWKWMLDICLDSSLNYPHLTF